MNIYVDLEDNGDLYIGSWNVDDWSPDYILVSGEGYWKPWGIGISLPVEFYIEFKHPEKVYEYYEGEKSDFDLEEAVKKGWAWGEFGIGIITEEIESQAVVHKSDMTYQDAKETLEWATSRKPWDFTEEQEEEIRKVIERELLCSDLSPKEIAREIFDYFDWDPWIDRTLDSLREYGREYIFTDESFEWDDFEEYIWDNYKCLPEDSYTIVEIAKEVANLLNEEVVRRAKEEGIDVEIWWGDEKFHVIGQEE